MTEATASFRVAAAQTPEFRKDVTGARGDRIAWGPTAILNPAGEVAAQLPLDAPRLLVFDLPGRDPAG